MEKNNNSKSNYNILDISKYNISKVDEQEDVSNIKEIQFKLIVIGDIAVGKSSIIKKLVKGNEDSRKSYQATIGFDIFKYKCKVKDIIINLNIWDTCGLIDFTAATKSLFTNACLAIVVYEIDKMASFKNVENWINLLKINSQPDTLIFLVGNKADLKDKREVKEEDGKEFVKLNNLYYFIETSATDNTSFVKDLFDQAMARLYEYYKFHQIKTDNDDNDEDREDFTKRKGTLKLSKDKKSKEKAYIDKGGGNCCNIF